MIIFILISLFGMVSAICTDNDGGQNFRIRGSTTGIQDPITKEVITLTDSCFLGPDNKEYVQEYYCGEGDLKNLIISTSEVCSYGCEDGKCKVNSKTGNYKRKLISCDENQKGKYIELEYDDGSKEKLQDSCGHSSAGGAYGVNHYFCGFLANNAPSYWSSIKPCKCQEGVCIEENFILQETEVNEISLTEDEIKVTLSESPITIKEKFSVKGEIEIISEEISASTKEKITIQKDSLKLEDAELLLPNEIYDKSSEKENIEKISLEKKEIPEYKINSKKQGKFLAIIPVKLDSETKFDARNGNLINTKLQKPWWFIGTTE